MAVAFDTKAPTFRHNLSETYKAHRPPMDEALRIQIPYIHEMIENWALHSLRLMVLKRMISSAHWPIKPANKAIGSSSPQAIKTWLSW